MKIKSIISYFKTRKEEKIQQELIKKCIEEFELLIDVVLQCKDVFTAYDTARKMGLHLGICQYFKSKSEAEIYQSIVGKLDLNIGHYMFRYLGVCNLRECYFNAELLGIEWRFAAFVLCHKRISYLRKFLK